MKVSGYLTITVTVISCSLVVTAFAPLLRRPLLVVESSCWRRTKSASQLHILISEEDEALEAAIDRQVCMATSVKGNVYSIRRL